MTSSESPAHESVRRGPLLARVGGFWAAYVAVLVATSKVKDMVPENWGPLAWGLASSALLFPLSGFMVRRDRVRMCEVGLNLEARSGLRFLHGLLLAWATFGVILGLAALVAGKLVFVRGTAIDAGLVGRTFATVLALALMEELGFRGYALRTLLRGFAVWPSQVIVALGFGLCHIAFGWPWSAVLLGVVPSALLMGMAAMRSGGLATAWGVHAGLNLAQWFFSESATGVWQVVIPDEAARTRVAQFAPGVGAVVTLASALAVWRWYPRSPEPNPRGAAAKVD